MVQVLILGSGGREHSIGESAGKSSRVTRVVYAPGNAGTGINNFDLKPAPENFEAIYAFIKFNKFSATIVGPEAPLAAGIVDYLHERGYHKVFGPTAQASKLESDKFFSYNLMEKLGIPQAHSIKCRNDKNYTEAAAAIDEIAAKTVVLKHRDLKEGKGVRVYDSKKQAHEDLEDFIETFGGDILVAERLYGEEFSVFAIADGNSVKLLEMAIQDHKPLLDGDKGPNTGGMGAYCPAPIATLEDLRKVEDYMTRIVQEIGFTGFLYAGMMKTEQGLKVIEWNIRFGDPEAQPAMMMLQNSIYDPIELALEGKLDEVDMQFKPGAAVCVVLASKGYPGSYKKGFPITGIKNSPNLRVYHAGTAFNKDRQVVTAGGRVLGVTGYSPNENPIEAIREAKALADEAVGKIHIPGGWQYRTDIASKALR